jgi:hypothetical protein
LEDCLQQLDTKGRDLHAALKRGVVLAEATPSAAGGAGGESAYKRRKKTADEPSAVAAALF